MMDVKQEEIAPAQNNCHGLSAVVSFEDEREDTIFFPTP